MPLTTDQKNKIKNHFSEIPKDMELFKGLIDVKMPEEDKKECLLAMINKFEKEIKEIKDIIEIIT